MTVEHDRAGDARHEHLLLPLRERDHGDTWQVELFHRREGCGELPFAAVDDDEVGRGSEALVEVASADPCEATADHLPHRSHVVLAREPADRERPVVRVLRLAVLEDRHRGDDRLSLNVRDVEALDAQRQALEVQTLAQLLERRDPAQPLLLALDGIGLERDAGVLGGQVRESLLLATGG